VPQPRILAIPIPDVLAQEILGDFITILNQTGILIDVVSSALQ
jgi:hypothetical protein